MKPIHKRKILKNHTNPAAGAAGGRARRLLFGGKLCGQARACLNTYIRTRLSRYCVRVSALYVAVYFPLSICLVYLDMEYRLQRSNLLIDEYVGGRTRLNKGSRSSWRISKVGFVLLHTRLYFLFIIISCLCFYS